MLDKSNSCKRIYYLVTTTPLIVYTMQLAALFYLVCNFTEDVHKQTRYDFLPKIFHFEQTDYTPLKLKLPINIKIIHANFSHQIFI